MPPPLLLLSSSRFWNSLRGQQDSTTALQSTAALAATTAILPSYTSHDGEKGKGREADATPLLPSSTSTYYPYLAWSTSKCWNLKRKLIAVFHFAVLALACLGCYDLIGFSNGRIMRTPVYSKYQLAQAGYLRASSTPTSSPYYSPYYSWSDWGYSPQRQRQEQEQQQQQQQQQQDKGSITRGRYGNQQYDGEHSPSTPEHQPRTPISSWTFPSSYSPPPHSSPSFVDAATNTNEDHVNSTSSSRGSSSSSSRTHASLNSNSNKNNNIFASSSSYATSSKASDQHLLILSPIRNAAHLLPTYFSHLESLAHPKSNTSIGILLSDEEDETGHIVQRWVDAQALQGQYRHITLLRKDFGLFMPSSGARHEDWLQAQRRSIMARARSLLLVSALDPTVDWVFWLDVDVKEMPRTIVADLLRYGGVQVEVGSEISSSAAVYTDKPTGQDMGKAKEAYTLSSPPSTMKAAKEDKKRGGKSSGKAGKSAKARAKYQPALNYESHIPADVIAPNIMYRIRGKDLRGYDQNNWAETTKSEKMKATLDPDYILHEGDAAHPTYRLHLASQWKRPNVTLDPFLPNYNYNNEQREKEKKTANIDINTDGEIDLGAGDHHGPSNLYDPTSEAFIGRQVPLDAVGGVATLVRASVHFFGGVFPSWNVDHAVETEGFGKLAKLVGARVVGLPNYIVVHR